MKHLLLASLLVLLPLAGGLHAQVAEPILVDTTIEVAHAILPNDAIIRYMPLDDPNRLTESTLTFGEFKFKPTVNFFFRPEGTFNYKEAGLPIDTGGLNFYLRGDFGAKLSLPKNIDLVFNLQSYGVYTRSLGPLDSNVKLYEGYVNMKKLDKKGRMSLQFGRMDIGVYGTEIIAGNAAFGQGRSFESVRYIYEVQKKWKSSLMWVQLYQEAPDTANFDWNHPIFLATFNTFKFSEAINFDANLPYIIDQYNSGYRTTVFMPDVRFFGKISNIRYSAEYILQTGTAKGILNENVTGTVNSYAVEVSAGVATTDNKFQIDLTYYRGSGDDNPADGDIKSYNVLWQNEHRRFGYIDAFKGSNVQATTLHFDWQFDRLISAGFHGVFANVLELEDRSTGIATGPIHVASTTHNDIGAGGDIYLHYYYNHNLNFQLSASMFGPGAYFTAVNGLDKAMTRLYLLMALKI